MAVKGFSMEAVTYTKELVEQIKVLDYDGYRYEMALNNLVLYHTAGELASIVVDRDMLQRYPSLDALNEALVPAIQRGIEYDEEYRTEHPREVCSHCNHEYDKDDLEDGVCPTCRNEENAKQKRLEGNPESCVICGDTVEEDSEHIYMCKECYSKVKW